MDHHNHHRIGPHINISTSSFDKLSGGHAYRVPRLPSVKSIGADAVNVGSIIHSIELEAYSAVLKAFKIQSDVLSWGKEGLITELRRELNITDHEHLKLLTGINSDESIRMIREFQKGTPRTRELPSSTTYAPGFLPGSVSSTSRQILKTLNPNDSAIHRYVSHNQPVTATPQFLLQSMDSQRNGKLSTYSTSNTEKPMKVVIPNATNPFDSKYSGSVRPQSNSFFYVADVDERENRSTVIQIRPTGKLLNKVENMVYGRKNPDQVHIERAKSILMKQEGAILEALAKLADVSDEDDSPRGFQYHESQKELHMMRKGTKTPKELYS